MENITERRDTMLQELEEYERERDRLKRVMEQMSGKPQTVLNRVINVAIVAAIVALAVVEFVFKLIPAILALEIGVLLVSVKIIWMMYMQEKAFHFQFWILNSLEYRINDMTKRLRSIEKATTGGGRKE